MPRLFFVSVPVRGMDCIRETVFKFGRVCVSVPVRGMGCINNYFVAFMRCKTSFSPREGYGLHLSPSLPRARSSRFSPREGYGLHPPAPYHAAGTPEFQSP